MILNQIKNIIFKLPLNIDLWLFDQKLNLKDYHN